SYPPSRGLPSSPNRLTHKCGIAGLMDASLTIRFEADPTHRFEAFDDAGEILLRGCLRPFPYPRQPGSPALVVNGQQLLKRTKPIRVDPFDERFIGGGRPIRAKTYAKKGLRGPFRRFRGLNRGDSGALAV